MAVQIVIKGKSRLDAERRAWEEKQLFMKLFRRPAYKIGGFKLCM